jgi:hypothetical protein
MAADGSSTGRTVFGGRICTTFRSAASTASRRAYHFSRSASGTKRLSARPRQRRPAARTTSAAPPAVRNPGRAVVQWPAPPCRELGQARSRPTRRPTIATDLVPNFTICVTRLRAGSCYIPAVSFQASTTRPISRGGAGLNRPQGGQPLLHRVMRHHTTTTSPPRHDLRKDKEPFARLPVPFDPRSANIRA